MRKLLICLSLVLVLTLVFVACNKNDTPDGNTNDVTTEAPTQAPTEKPSTPAETEAPTEAPTTEEPTTEAPTTEAPTTEAPTTEEPTTEEPTTEAPTTEPAECEHVYGEPEVTEADCENDGKSVVTCTKCGDTVETVIEALGHKIAEDAEWNVLVAPTCEEIGLGFGFCVNCEQPVEAELPALGHNANEATCTTASVCATCNTTVAPALPHNTVTVDAKAPTCTEVGYNAGTYCADCGSIDALVIPAIGHNYVWAVETKPTFTAEGVNKGVCANCGDVQTMTVEKRVPSLIYTAADLIAGTNVSYKNVIVTPAADGSYVTLTPKAYGASISFLLAEGQKFGDVISVKYRVSADYVSFATNKDAYFNVNGKAFYASMTGKNVVDYDNVGTAGEWTLLNIDFRKSQITIDGVEYDMFNGAALETIEYVLFNGYREGLSIDIAYVTFLDTVADAEAYGTTQGEVATPVVYAPTEKDYTTTLDNINGAGEYNAPGKFLYEINNNGVSVVDWTNRFYNNLNLTITGKVTVAGGAQKLVYSLDGGLTWLEFAEGAATVNADGTYTAKLDLSAMEGKTISLRIAAVLSTNGKTTEYASVLNLKNIVVKKGNLNDTVTLDYLASAGNQQSNINATVKDGYVHYVVSGKSPTITLFKSEEGMKVGQYMLIKYRGNGSGYGTNYDFYFDINGKPNNNIGGKKYAANWFNLNLNNEWNYIIVDLANGFNGKTFDMNNVTLIDWIVFDGTITDAKGNWIDIAAVQFFDSYDAARTVANPNGKFITEMENGSTYTAYTVGATATYNYATGTAKPTVVKGADNRLDSVTLTAPDYMLVFISNITSNVAFAQTDVGVMIEGYGIMWDITNAIGDNNYQVGLPIPEDFVNGREYTVSVVLKSKTNSEIVLIDTFKLTRLPEGVSVVDNDGNNDGKLANKGTIGVSASAGGANDVVALYKDGTLVMYYGAYSGATGFKKNGGANITVVDAGLAALTDGTYTIKLHKGSVNGEAVAETTATLITTGELMAWTARDIYNYMKAYPIPLPTGVAGQWAFRAELRNDGQGEYVRLTTDGIAAVGAGRLFLAMGEKTIPDNAYIGLRYRNHKQGSIPMMAGPTVGHWSSGGYKFTINTAHSTTQWYNSTCWTALYGSNTFLSMDFYFQAWGFGDGEYVDIQYIIVSKGGADLNSSEANSYNSVYGW